jgi:hypothetical protein
MGRIRGLVSHADSDSNLDFNLKNFVVFAGLCHFQEGVAFAGDPPPDRLQFTMGPSLSNTTVEWQHCRHRKTIGCGPEL